MLRLSYTITTWLALASQPAIVQSTPPVKSDSGVNAHAFDMDQVTLGTGRWHDNQDRTVNYLKFVNIDRMLYVYRENHGLSTKGAPTNGGWDAPK